MHSLFISYGGGYCILLVTQMSQISFTQQDCIWCQSNVQVTFFHVKKHCLPCQPSITVGPNILICQLTMKTRYQGVAAFFYFPFQHAYIIFQFPLHCWVYFLMGTTSPVTFYGPCSYPAVNNILWIKSVHFHHTEL